DKKQNSPQSYRLAPVKSVEAVDDTTLKIQTKQPFPTLLYELGQVQIVQNNAVLIGEKITKPIGTGPYRFSEWRKDDRVILEANPNYWTGAPKFKRIVFRIIPETSTRVNELKAGTVDVVKNLLPSHIKELQNDKNFKIYSVPSVRLMYLGFRVDNQGIPLKVRQAIAHAIDREALTKYILEGQATPATTLVSPSAFGFHDSLKPFPYDVEKAKQMIKDAGAVGRKVRFDSTSGKYIGDVEVAKALAEMMEKIGLQIDLQTLEYGSYLKNVNEKPEAYLFAWGQPSPDADAALYRNFHSSNKPRMRYSNPLVDKLLDEGRSTLDKGKRLAAYKQVQEILKEDTVWIPLYFLNFTAGVRANVEGVQVMSNEKIWLDKAYSKE
ncbi:MAG: ABC transporter substrate-binding protein, partial [Actinobacteria bacterium]|nr:ABC transporter substrate-binding protein [Actinomycetota bacterium]